MTLDANGLSCGYGDTCVVHDISFTLDQGRVLTVLGPNGVGKTTFFKTVLGFLPAQKGTVTIDERPIAQLSRPALAQSIAYVPQTQDIPFAYTIEDVVFMGRACYLKLLQQLRPVDYHVADQVLRLMGIDHLAHKACSEVSGGELQLAFIARALAQEPKYLVMDEPTASLDFGNQMHVLEHIMELTEHGIGVLMTTHDPNQAFMLKSDVLLLQREMKHNHGYYRDILTSDELSCTYGVNVSVHSIPHADGRIDCCLALPRRRTSGTAVCDDGSQSASQQVGIASV